MHPTLLVTANSVHSFPSLLQRSYIPNNQCHMVHVTATDSGTLSTTLLNQVTHHQTTTTISAQGIGCTPILIHPTPLIPANPSTPHVDLNSHKTVPKNGRTLPCATSKPYHDRLSCTMCAACCTTLLAHICTSPASLLAHLTTLAMLLGRVLVPADSPLICNSLQLLQLRHRGTTIGHTEKAPDTPYPDCVAVSAELHVLTSKGRSVLQTWTLHVTCMTENSERSMSRSSGHSSNGMLCQHCNSLHRMQHVAAKRMLRHKAWTRPAHMRTIEYGVDSLWWWLPGG